MKRRRLLLAGWALVMAAPRVVAGPLVAKVPRIGLFWIAGPDDTSLVEAFRQALRTHGFIDGRTVHIDTRSLVDRYDRLEDESRKLVDRVDLIVCYGATATLAARRATATIPLVMVTGGDPVKLGVAASLSRPGGNVTGITMLTQDLIPKRLEVLTEVIPGIRRIGVLYNPESAAEVAELARWQAAVDALQLKLERLEITVPDDIVPVVSRVTRDRVDAVGIVASTMFVAHRRALVAALAKTRLPAIFPSTDDARVGGLLSYGSNIAEGFARAATQAAKILNGERPADIPFEQATKIELAVNSRTARELDLAIPQPFLLRADKVFN